MKAYLAFVKKEMMESVRTYRLLILLAVFLLFGVMSPLAAKLMPEILKGLALEGIQISLGEPSALDAWAQFFKNVTQMGLIVVTILFSGMLPNEFSRGTLIILLTKGLPRKTVVLAKFTVAALAYTLGYLVCFGVCFGYTMYFWGGDDVRHLLFSVFCLWLFGVLPLASLSLGGALSGSVSGSLLFAGAVTALLFLADLVPALRAYNPLRLASDNMALLTGVTKPGDLVRALPVCCALSAGFVAGAAALFDRKQLLKDRAG